YAQLNGIQPAPAGLGVQGDFLIRSYGNWFKNKDLLQYDDGTACWLTNAGTYRGTWFDVEDFLPGMNFWYADYSEFWFYHSAGYPWDTSQFYAELWNGEANPDEFINRQTITAFHFAPCFAYYYPHILLEADFWIIVNTELSESGCPSLLCDEYGNITGEPHSFFSYDFSLWEPWTTSSVDLSRASWGSIKGLFR
ncbi:MAG: hypothetical protein KAT09_06180, partial [Candidatus Aegiribacteria sp.]|nr:hypothetical protein [Candidatus Aegiribacteria sp.]